MTHPRKILLTCLLLSVLIPFKILAQNIFPQKVEGCDTHAFCLDCGDPKATYDSIAFASISEKISQKYNLAGIRGSVIFQVMVDSAGNGCVISHTDTHGSPLSKELVKYLNTCTWIPAKEKNKTTNSSINVRFDVKDSKISGYIQRIDMAAMNANMKNPGEPDIYNKTYQYSNPSLNSYDITVWQKENSDLPQDMSQHLAIDKQDHIWYATLNGFTKFDGSKFLNFNEQNSPFKSTTDISAIAIDKEDNKWMFTDNAIYKFDNQKWEKYDSTKIAITGAYHIIPNNEEIFFCDDKGLGIYSYGKWTLLNKDNTKQLPSNRVYYAFRDQKKRLWIGTFSGSIMIDEKNNITELNSTNTPLKNICISGATTDDQGNIYFIPYAYNNSARNKEEEGLIILSNDGKWNHYNDKNSGLPANNINSLLFDKFEKVLWIGTSTGLVRFDLKNSWELYHNQNSKVPSIYIYDMAQNSKGDIYISTYNGMMRIRKRR